MKPRILSQLEHCSEADLAALETEQARAANYYDMLSAMVNHIRDVRSRQLEEEPARPALPAPTPREAIEQAHQRHQAKQGAATPARPAPSTNGVVKLNNGAKCWEYRRKAKELLEARHDESFRPTQLANAIGCPHGSITAVLKHPWFMIGVHGEVKLTLAAKADVGMVDEGGE